VRISFKTNPTIIALLCSSVIISNALYIFVTSIYPLISNEHISSILSRPIFYLNIISQEIFAYSLLSLGLALLGRSRGVWIATLVNLGLILISNIWLHTIYHSNLLIVINIVLLILNFRYFDKPLYLSSGLAFAIEFVIFALCYGVFGSYLLRGEFKNLNTISDAIYYSIVTYSTVGYGDIYPATNTAKYFVISMIIMGLVMFTSGITLIIYMFNNKLKHLLFNINKGKIPMSDHVIFLGYSIMTKILVERLQKEGKNFVVIDIGANMDTDREILREQDKLMITPYHGNKETFARTRVSEAKLIIVSFDNDSDTVITIMSVHEYLQDFTHKPKILARIYYPENINKAKLAGADEVIAPHLLAADAIQNLNIL
jgi:voltage-gated potassium channel